MFQINKIILNSPYSFNKNEKYKIYCDALNKLNKHHYNNCPEYKDIINILQFRFDNSNIEDAPFLPVRLFKEYELLSINTNEIFKIMNSSGTSGNVSKIFLDKENANLQRNVLTRIVSSFIGKKRLPMLIIDSKSIIQNTKLFSARVAGILGFSIFGKDITYALDDNYQLDIDKIHRFSKKYHNDEILIFGFTSIIYKHLLKYANDSNIQLPKFNGIMIHGGGWKKLHEIKIDNQLFMNETFDTIGIKNVINYYGMIEQTGSIFLECPEGFLHSSIFSDVLIRNNDFSLCGLNEIGIVQLISLLPTSYPGHNILSDDLGEIKGVDNCKCGRLGKYFIIHGRIPNAELRGCSDTIN